MSSYRKANLHTPANRVVFVFKNGPLQVHVRVALNPIRLSFSSTSGLLFRPQALQSMRNHLPHRASHGVRLLASPGSGKIVRCL